MVPVLLLHGLSLPLAEDLLVLESHLQFVVLGCLHDVDNLDVLLVLFTWLVLKQVLWCLFSVHFGHLSLVEGILLSDPLLDVVCDVGLLQLAVTFRLDFLDNFLDRLEPVLRLLCLLLLSLPQQISTRRILDVPPCRSTAISTFERRLLPSKCRRSWLPRTVSLDEMLARLYH